MELNHLQQIVYEKLADYIATDSLTNAERLVNILERLVKCSPYLMGAVAIGNHPQYEAQQFDYREDSFVQPSASKQQLVNTHYQTILNSNQSDATLPPAKSSYEWADGYVDPREKEDYWNK